MAVDVTNQTPTGPDDPTPEPASSAPRRPAGPPPPLVVEQWSPDARGKQARLGVKIGIGLLVLLIAGIVPDIYTNLVSRAAVFGMVALSMNLLVGYAGQVSLGHAAFFGAGAFAAAYGISELALPWGFGLLVSAVSGGFAALLLGGVALRVKGLYLAIVTIAYGLFAQEVIFSIPSLTGGGAGAFAPRPALFTGDLAYAYLCIAVLGLLLVFDTLLAGSKSGRAIRALRDDERVAASWGINVTGYKLMAFVLSGVIAAIAGGLFASIEQVVAPADFQFSLSLTFLLMTVVGGAGNRFGVVQGGILFATLPTLLEVAHETFSWIPGSTFEPVISAGLLILTLTLFPGGIAQQQADLHRWLGGGKFHDDGQDPFTHPPAVLRGGTVVTQAGADSVPVAAADDTVITTTEEDAEDD